MKLVTLHNAIVFPQEISGAINGNLFFLYTMSVVVPAPALPDSSLGGTTVASTLEVCAITACSAIFMPADKTTHTLDIVTNNAEGSAVRVGAWDGKAVQPLVTFAPNGVAAVVPLTASAGLIASAVSTANVATATLTATGAVAAGSFATPGAVTAGSFATPGAVTAGSVTATSINTKSLTTPEFSSTNISVDAAGGFYFGKVNDAASWRVIVDEADRNTLKFQVFTASSGYVTKLAIRP